MSRVSRKPASAYSKKILSRSTKCQIEGCCNDLPSDIAYYKRRKICPFHATLSQMMLDGKVVRFCQHCGRFQALNEFDGERKSCMKSLHRHNKWRRERSKASSKSRGSKTSQEISSEGATATTDGANQSNGGSNLNGNQQCCEFDIQADGSQNAMNRAQSSTLPQIMPRFASLFSTNLPSPPPLMALPPVVTLPSEPHVAPMPPAFSTMEPSDTVHNVDMCEDPEELLPAFIDDNMDGLFDETIGSLAYLDDDTTGHRNTATTAPVPFNGVSSLPPSAPFESSSAPSFVGEHTWTLPQQQQQQQQDFRQFEPLPSHMLAPFTPEDRLVHLCLKLFGVEPRNLPEHVRAPLQNIVFGGSVPDTLFHHGIRHGCTFIGMSTLVSKEEERALLASGASGLLQAALAAGHELTPTLSRDQIISRLPGNLRAVAQMQDQLAFAGASPDAPSSAVGGDDQNIQSIAPAVVPRITSLVPLAMKMPSQEEAKNLKTNSVLVFGHNISESHDAVTVRHKDAFPNVEVLRQGMVDDMYAVLGNASRATLDAVHPRHPPRSKSRSFPGDTDGEEAAPPEEEEFVLLRLPTARAGLHHVEVQRKHVLSSPLSFLVLEDERAVWEIRKLESPDAAIPNAQEFVQSVGLVLDHLAGDDPQHQGLQGQGEGHPNGSAAVAHRIARLAQRVLAVCVARGWYALARLMLPAIVPPGGRPAEALAAVQAATNGGVYDVLHLAALNGCMETLNVLKEWGEQAGHEWQCKQGGGVEGITPLHVLAENVSPHSTVVAATLTALLPNGLPLWYTATSARGITPIDAARAAGNAALLSWLAKSDDIADESLELKHGQDEGGATSPTTMSTAASKSDGDDADLFFSASTSVVAAGSSDDLKKPGLPPASNDLPPRCVPILDAALRRELHAVIRNVDQCVLRSERRCLCGKWILTYFMVVCAGLLALGLKCYVQ